MNIHSFVNHFVVFLLFIFPWCTVISPGGRGLLSTKDPTGGGANMVAKSALWYMNDPS